MSQAIDVLTKGEPISNILNAENKKLFKTMNLLTIKPILYVCNILDSDISKKNIYVDMVKKRVNPIVLSVRIESEISLLESKEEKEEFLQAMSLESSGLDKLIFNAYRLLDLITYFTAGEKETRSLDYQKKYFSSSGCWGNTYRF